MCSYLDSTCINSPNNAIDLDNRLFIQKFSSYYCLTFIIITFFSKDKTMTKYQLSTMHYCSCRICTQSKLLKDYTFTGFLINLSLSAFTLPIDAYIT